MISVLKGSPLLLCGELTDKSKRETMGLVRTLAQPSRQERMVACTRLSGMGMTKNG